MALYFVTGKGGVGKTQLSASLAMHLAKELNTKTLLVEFSKINQYAEYFEKKIGSVPVEYLKNFYVASWDGFDCLREYAQKVLHSQRAADFLLSNKTLKSLIELAPGLKEIAVLGKLTSDYRKNSFSTGFENIIFDAPSSGHFLSIMQIPKGLSSIVSGGAMGRQSRSIQEALELSEFINYFLIYEQTTLSKKESEETVDKLAEVIGNNKNIKTLQNKSDLLPDVIGEGWIERAKNLEPYWEKIVK